MKQIEIQKKNWEFKSSRNSNACHIKLMIKQELEVAQCVEKGLSSSTCRYYFEDLISSKKTCYMYQVKVNHKRRKKGQQFMGKHTKIKIESRNSDNSKNVFV